MIVHSRRRCLLTQFLECCMYIVHLYIQYSTVVTIWSWNIIFWFSRTLGLCLLCYCLLCMISDFFAHDLKVTSYLSMKVSDLFSRDLEVGDLFPLSEGQWPFGSWSKGHCPLTFPWTWPLTLLMKVWSRGQRHLTVLYLFLKVSDLFSQYLKVSDLLPLSEGQWPLTYLWQWLLTSLWSSVISFTWSRGQWFFTSFWRSVTSWLMIWRASALLWNTCCLYLLRYDVFLCPHKKVEFLCHCLQYMYARYLCANILVGIRNIAYTKRTCLVKKVLDVHGL